MFRRSRRNLALDLRKTLASIGMEDVLIRCSGELSVRTDRIDCDYYRMLRGDLDAVNAFQGEYMEQYSWAEPTKGRLHFRNRNKPADL